MRKKIIWILMILVAILLQSSVFPMTPFPNFTPNLLMVLIISGALFYGSRFATVLGFVCGLFMDLSGSGFFGIYALIYLWIGYLAGKMYLVFFEDDLKIPIFFSGLATFVAGTISALIRIYAQDEYGFMSALKYLILPECITTMLAALILYKPIYLLYRSVTKFELEAKQSPWLKK